MRTDALCVERANYNVVMAYNSYPFSGMSKTEPRVRDMSTIVPDAVGIDELTSFFLCFFLSLIFL